MRAIVLPHDEYVRHLVNRLIEIQRVEHARQPISTTSVARYSTKRVRLHQQISRREFKSILQLVGGTARTPHHNERFRARVGVGQEVVISRKASEVVRHTRRISNARSRCRCLVHMNATGKGGPWSEPAIRKTRD